MAEADPDVSGGSAVAQLVALAASTAASAADRSRQAWNEAGGARAQAQALHRRALELAERVEVAYSAAREALAQRGAPAAEGSADEHQHAPDEHQHARDWRLGVAVEEAAQPPLELAASAADVAQLAQAIAARAADEVRADAVIAAELAAAAASSAARLVEINLVVGRDQRFVEAARRYAEIAAAAAAAADAIDL